MYSQWALSFTWTLSTELSCHPSGIANEILKSNLSHHGIGSLDKARNTLQHCAIRTALRFQAIVTQDLSW